jgi:ubiquinone/menaquinone biosynthesis C-methylase UbiE
MSMAGVLSEQDDPARYQRVLDVGCGTGTWLIETARTYPQMKWLVGVDVSRTFVEYARAQAEAAQVSDRVEFHVMNALRMLEFPNGSFDLVNQRAGTSWLRTWDWRKLLEEYQRVACAGGVIRITEFELVSLNTSPALTRLCDLFVEGLFRAGHLFTPESAGLTGQLSRLLEQHGLENVQTHEYLSSTHAGTEAWQGLCDEMRLGAQTFVPFLHKWTRLPDDYDDLCQQMIAEMQSPDFVATGRLLTAWGNAQRRSPDPAHFEH